MAAVYLGRKTCQSGRSDWVTKQSNLRRNLPNIHQHAPNNSGAQPARKSPHPLIASDAPKAPDRVRVVRALSGRPRAVGAHADEDHLCRVADHARQAARHRRGADGGAEGELVARGGF